MSMSTTLSICTAYCIYYCHAVETLNALYTLNTELASSTEYIINRNVIIEENAIFYIPNNTNISFTGDYTLTVRGSLIIGCEDIDTASDHKIGIIDHDSSVLVYGNDSNKQQGGILIDSTGIASFCNTKFENLYNAIALNSPYKFILDNCEFENNYCCLYVDVPSYEQRQITDNIFSYSKYGIYDIYHYALIENNIFVDIKYTAIDAYSWNEGVYVNNNTFINDYQHSLCAIYNYAYANITSNTFINFTNALVLDGRNAMVKYNEFINNHIAVVINAKQNQYIQYNNFISNDYNIELQNNYNQPNCNYNFNGVTTNPSSPKLIADKMIDFCDSNGYNGIITFWPYFQQKLFLTPVDNSTALYTFDFFDCISINDASGYLITRHPTTSPTTTISLTTTISPSTTSMETESVFSSTKITTLQLITTEKTDLMTLSSFDRTLTFVLVSFLICILIMIIWFKKRKKKFAEMEKDDVRFNQINHKAGNALQTNNVNQDTEMMPLPPFVNVAASAPVIIVNKDEIQNEGNIDNKIEQIAEIKKRSISMNYNNNDSELVQFINDEITIDDIIKPKIKDDTENEYDMNEGKQTFDDVKSWLESLNLIEYHDKFVSEGYESISDILLIESEDDLKLIGIDKAGHRKRILKSIDNISFLDIHLHM
eukprot:457861_1